MTGEIFWKRVSNAARFLDDAVDELLCDRSVVLNFEDSIPWEDIMIERIKDKLFPSLGMRSLDQYSCADTEDPGEFLLQRYFNDRERKNYWPARGSLEQFMAENPNTPMHRRIIFITDIPGRKAHRWIASVSDYLNHCPDPDEHAVFLLMTEGSAFTGSESAAAFSYSDYISEYDCLMLCMNLLSDSKCSSLVKKYISELAVQLSDNHLEYAGQLTEYGLDLLRRTRDVVRTVYPELTFDEAVKRTEQSLWEAQIRIVYPELEHYRREFVKKHQNVLEKYLPVTDSAGERITEAGGLELGQLHMLCTTYHLCEKTEYDRLCHMRNARNSLAHGNTVSYEDLVKMGIC